MNKSLRPLTSVFLIFIVVLLTCLLIPDQLRSFTIDPTVLLVGNIILLIATLISFIFYRRSFENNRPAFFMRMIYSAMFTKMLICLFSAVIYIMAMKKNVSKGGIFACMFLYFVYTFIELSTVLKLSKKKENA